MAEPIWLDSDLAEIAHTRALKTHGGAYGIRDSSGLSAAMESPRNQWAYTREKNLFALAAHLLMSMVKNHPFNDANKRTAISLAVMFLGANGIQIRMTDEDLYFQTVRAARCKEKDREKEKDSIALWLQLAALRG
ncbi:type II toxin-antitoxin system death-on-curing family toxin [Synechococcus sp. AH-224-I15]|nr:type II toxin-antitoxin system death-on-curing family toxin [Synechococcus sp. AH-224-I15]